MPSTADSAATRIVRLERDGDERGPAVQRLAADVQWILEHRHPVLQRVTGDRADESPDEHDERQPRGRQAERFVQLLDRKRRIGVHAPVALEPRVLRRRDEGIRILELGHQAIQETSVISHLVI